MGSRPRPAIRHTKCLGVFELLLWPLVLLFLFMFGHRHTYFAILRIAVIFHFAISNNLLKIQFIIFSLDFITRARSLSPLSLNTMKQKKEKGWRMRV